MSPAGCFCGAWEGARQLLRDAIEFAAKKGNLEKNFADQFIVEWVDFNVFLPAFLQTSKNRAYSVQPLSLLSFNSTVSPRENRRTIPWSENRFFPRGNTFLAGRALPAAVAQF